MTNATTIAVGTLLFLIAGRLTLIRSKLKTLCVLLRGWWAVQVRLALLRNNGMTITAHRLYDN